MNAKRGSKKQGICGCPSDNKTQVDLNLATKMLLENELARKGYVIKKAPCGTCEFNLRIFAAIDMPSSRTTPISQAGISLDIVELTNSMRKIKLPSRTSSAIEVRIREESDDRPVIDRSANALVTLIAPQIPNATK